MEEYITKYAMIKNFNVPLTNSLDDIPLYDIDVFTFIEHVVQEENERKVREVMRK